MWVLHQSSSHSVVTWTVGPSLKGTVGESLTRKELFNRQNAPLGNILIVYVCVCVCASTANAKHRLGFNSLSRTPRGINHRYKHRNCILSGWSHRSVICNILKAWNQKLNHTHSMLKWYKCWDAMMRERASFPSSLTGNNTPKPKFKSPKWMQFAMLYLIKRFE